MSNRTDGEPFRPLDPSDLEHFDVLEPTAADLDAAIVAAGSRRGVVSVLHPHRPAVVRRRGVRRLIVLPALALVAAAGIQLAPASTAQAATSPTGPGLTLRAEGHAVHVGSYRIGGKLLYCTDWGLQIGDGAVRTGAGAPRLDAETRARVNALVNTWGATTDNRQAARVKLAVDTLIAPRNARLAKVLPGMLSQLTAADRTAIADMASRAAIHGPYRVSRGLAGAIPGQRGTAVVTVLGSNGRPAAGRKVTFKLTGGSVALAQGSTDAKGRATLTYTASTTSQSFTADVVSPSSSAVWQNAPTAGHQLMVGGGFTETAHTSGSVTLCPITLRVTRFCDCDHDGLRKVEVTVAADDHVGGRHVDVLVDGAVKTGADLSAGATRTITLQVPARAVVTARYSFPGSAYSETVEP